MNQRFDAASAVRQASEKGWGAAAQILKVAVNQREWDHGYHRHLCRVCTGFPRPHRRMDDDPAEMAADSLHGNFYGGEHVAADVTEALDKIAALIGRLEPPAGA